MTRWLINGLAIHLSNYATNSPIFFIDPDGKDVINADARAAVEAQYAANIAEGDYYDYKTANKVVDKAKRKNFSTTKAFEKYKSLTENRKHTNKA